MFVIIQLKSCFRSIFLIFYSEGRIQITGVWKQRALEKSGRKTNGIRVLFRTLHNDEILLQVLLE
jgi:hypothetical protein